MVALIIPVFNKIELTRRCLLSLLKHSKALTSIIVIDNGSSDHTPVLLIEFQSAFITNGIEFQIIQNSKNLGYGSACNQGVRLAAKNEQVTYIAILNNDTWLMPAWDLALIDAINQKKLNLVGPFFDERPWTEKITERAILFLAQNKEKFRKHFVPILLFFTREAIQKLSLDHGGIFDERFFVTYEDSDLFYRMKQLQMTYGQTSQCYIWHQSMGTRSEKGFLPENYELDGLRIFKEKWGFDPRAAEHTVVARLKRRVRKVRAAIGRF